MFNDSEVNGVGFNHVKMCKKGKTDISSQYNGFLIEDKSYNTFDVKTLATQTDESFVTGNLDFKALKNCLEKGLNFLETECYMWPKFNDYSETTDNGLNMDEVITVSIK